MCAAGVEPASPSPRLGSLPLGQLSRPLNRLLSGAGPGVEPGLLLIRTKMVLGAGFEPARMRIHGTSPCLKVLRISRSGTVQFMVQPIGVLWRVFANRQTWLSNPSLVARRPKSPSDHYISRPDIARNPFVLCIFRVSFRFSASSRRAVEPPPRVCRFPPAQDDVRLRASCTAMLDAGRACSTYGRAP